MLNNILNGISQGFFPGMLSGLLFVVVFYQWIVCNFTLLFGTFFDSTPGNVIINKNKGNSMQQTEWRDGLLLDIIGIILIFVILWKKPIYNIMSKYDDQIIGVIFGMTVSCLLIVYQAPLFKSGK